jgi:quaternary ammonium compound-resistance protein SugE
MGWLFVVLAGICEIFYAAAMPKTNGFTNFWPSVFCISFIIASMYLLSLSARTLPIGTAYAVWVGIGAVGTAVYGMIALGEDSSFPRLVCFMLIIAGIIGLKVLSAE